MISISQIIKNSWVRMREKKHINKQQIAFKELST